MPVIDLKDIPKDILGGRIILQEEIPDDIIFDKPQRPRNEIDDKMDLLIEGKQKRLAEQESQKIDEDKFTGEMEDLKLQNPLLYKEINTMAEKGESPDLIKKYVGAKAKPDTFGVSGGFPLVPEHIVAGTTSTGVTRKIPDIKGLSIKDKQPSLEMEARFKKSTSNLKKLESNISKMGNELETKQKTLDLTSETEVNSFNNLVNNYNKSLENYENRINEHNLLVNKINKIMEHGIIKKPATIDPLTGLPSELPIGKKEQWLPGVKEGAEIKAPKFKAEPKIQRFRDIIKSSWKTGSLVMDRGELGSMARDTGMSLEDTLLKSREIDKQAEEARIEIPELDIKKPSTWTRNLVAQTTELLPFMGRGQLKGMETGLKTGIGFGTIAALMGQAGPQALTPEEIFTVPGATATGMASGWVLGALENSMDVEGGNLYIDMLERGIEPKYATNLSRAGGLAIGLIEIAQIGRLAKKIPGTNLFFKQGTEKLLASKTINSLIKKSMGYYAKDVGVEIGEEELQEIVGIAIEAVGSILTPGAEQMTFSEAKDRIIGIITNTGLGFMGLALPGNVLQTASRAKSLRAKATTTAKPVKPGTFGVSGGFEELAGVETQKQAVVTEPEVKTEVTKEPATEVAEADDIKFDKQINTIHGSKYFNVEWKGYEDEIRYSDHQANGESLTDIFLKDLIKIGEDIYYEPGNLRVYSKTINKNQKTITKALKNTPEFLNDIKELAELEPDFTKQPQKPPEVAKPVLTPPEAEITQPEKPVQAEVGKKETWEMTKGELFPLPEESSAVISKEGNIYTGDVHPEALIKLENAGDTLPEYPKLGYVINGKFYEHKEGFGALHKQIIQQAQERGEEIPDNVLADYPDLVKQEYKRLKDDYFSYKFNTGTPEMQRLIDLERIVKGKEHEKPKVQRKSPEERKAEITPTVKEAKGKETVLTKIKKFGKTYNVVKKPDGELILRSKTDTIPYSYDEYNRHLRRSAGSRKGVITRTEGKAIFKHDDLADYPALGTLMGKGMRIRTGVGNDSVIKGELKDLWDGILIGTTPVNAKSPMDLNKTINEDRAVEEFNQTAHDYHGWSESQYIQTFDELVRIAQNELSEAYSHKGEPVLDEIERAQADNLRLSPQEFLDYQAATTPEEKENILNEAYKDEIMGVLDLTEDEYNDYIKASPEEQDKILNERMRIGEKEHDFTDKETTEILASAKSEAEALGITEEELERNFKENIEYFESKITPEKPETKPLKKLNANLTEVLFDTKDAKTGEAIKAGEMAWRIEDTGEFLKESTYKGITERPEQEALFAEEVAKNTEEVKAKEQIYIERRIGNNPKERIYFDTKKEANNELNRRIKLHQRGWGLYKKPLPEAYLKAKERGELPKVEEGFIKKEVGQAEIPELYGQKEIEFERGEKGFAQIGEKPQKTTQFTFSNPETEQRYQSAKGLKVENIYPRIRSNLRSFWHKVSREYEHLPRTKEFAQLRFGLLRLSKQKGVSSDKTIRELNDITENLNKDEYDLFNRKVITADLLEMAEEEKSLPYGFEKEILETDSKNLDSFIAENKNISDSIKKRGEVWDGLKNEYTESMKLIGYDVSEKLTRKNYFRHQVLDYARMKSLWGTGRRLKTPAARGFLRKRYGSKLDINADYLQAEHEVMAQMTYDIQVAKTIKNIDDNYNMLDNLKKEAKKQKTDWHNLIPEGYVEWQPREGNLFYLADTIPSKLAEQLASDMIEKIGVSKEQVNKALAMGRKRKEFIVKEEVALTLDNLVKERTSNAIAETHKNIIRRWKQWQLISPRRYPKYNFRNLTGDADATFAGSPSVFLKTQQAVKELYNVYVSDKKLTGNVKDWFDRGGTISTLQAQEMDELNKLNTFVELKQDVKRKEVPKEIWKKYWKIARVTTDFRESILRYAAYIDYLEQMENNPEGKPKNFGASKPEEIMGLSDIKDRAYWLSNDLLGAYDKVSVYGQSLREHIYPFWSWKEVNFKRYVQMFRNAASDEKFCRTVGRKTVGSIATTPFKLYRIGKFVIKASALVSATSLLWNKMIMGDEDDELPEDVRNRPHITFGKDKDGNVMYFTRIGALGDLLEWFNLDAAPFYVDQFRKGKMSIKEIAKDMAKAPLNMFIQGVEPFTKTTAELITRRSLYPDLFAPGTVRDRGLHVARSFGIADEYIALTGKPSRGYKKTISKFFIYKSDPLESAYWDVLDEKRRFLKSKGKIYEGFWLTPRGNVLYNLKLALRFGDKKSADEYLTEYIKLGGTEKGLEQSFNMMDPTYGLPDDEEEFAEYLGKEGMEKMAKALVFYDDLLNSKTELAGKFPSKYRYK